MRERAEFDSVYLRTMHASSALLDRTRIRPDPVAILRSTGAALQSIDYDPSGKIVFTGWVTLHYAVEVYASCYITAFDL